jgi:uncharacterized protein YbjT (DUF2867 family)
MHVLVTGANGYIGRRLISALMAEGHHVVALVRRPEAIRRFEEAGHEHFSILKGDVADSKVFESLAQPLDAAYYLIHSMSSPQKDLEASETMAAEKFALAMTKNKCRQIIYLGGMVPEGHLSEHLRSRFRVEDVLRSSGIPLTVLRSAIIIGSGSASFEIMRDLVEKLPIMLAPRWLKSKCQPIAVRDAISYLKGVLLNPDAFHQTYDIGGPDVLTYKEMLLTFARLRHLRRVIISVPFLTPQLSSLWLTLVTAVPFPLARSLVKSLVHDVVAKDNSISNIIPLETLGYEKAITLALEKMQSNYVYSKWSDETIPPTLELHNFYVPTNGCYKDVRKVKVHNSIEALKRIWSIGGENGWYHGNFLWQWRGIIDKICGGVGLRRGRRNPTELVHGDVVDFWRVIYADDQQRRLLLYAEMKLPGEAWLEFKIVHEDNQDQLVQVATFRPRGILGRLYWWSVYPLHHFIFPGMANKIAGRATL